MLRKLQGSLDGCLSHKPISVFRFRCRNVHVNSFNTHNYTSLLLSCIRTLSLGPTKQIHAQLIITSLFSHTHLSNLTLESFSGTHLANLALESYFKCGEPNSAYRVLDEMPERDSFSWSPAIAFYARNKQYEKAVRVFGLMNRDGCDSNRASLVSALNSCCNLSDFVLGTQLHSQILKRIPPCDVIFGNVLIDFYSKCGQMNEAVRVFDEFLDRDLVSWTSLLSGYSHNGLSKEAWKFFTVMNGAGVGFSHYALSVCVKACGDLEDCKPGKALHCLIIKTGFHSHVVVSSALVGMYAKHRNLTCSRKIFDLMVEPNVISWTSIITGYVQNDEGEEALKLFRLQVCKGVPVDPYSLSSILAGCANIPALEFGKQVHILVIKLGFEFQVFAGSSLVCMYSRCGCLCDAQQALDWMSSRDVITWTAMIAGYAQHGHGSKALEMFDQMREAKIEPNAITFVAVLSACSRSGLVEVGRRYFESMEPEYGIKPREEHFTCMVDILARAGRVKEADEFMKKIPFELSARAWGALLSGCRASGELELGLKCAQELFRLEPELASNHVLLANMYAANGRWEEMGTIRGLMKEKGLKKESGYSWIECEKEVGVFGVSDYLHPQTQLIYDMLHQLSFAMENCEAS